MIQYLILAVGTLLVLTTVDLAAIGRKAISIFRSVEGAIVNIPAPHIPDLHIPSPKPTPVVPTSHEHGLVELVQQWESLKQSCIDNNLTDAVEKLDEIFPTLIKPQTEKASINEKS